MSWATDLHRIHIFWCLLSVLGLLTQSVAQPVSVPFSFCAPSTVTEPNPLKRVNVTGVYGQLYHPNGPDTTSLKLTAFGEIGEVLEGYSNQTGYLATLFTSTNYLTFSVFDNTSSLCESIRPPSPLPALVGNDTNYCPIPAGPLAFGLSVPLSGPYSLKTMVTQIRIVDSSSPAHELACLEVAVTPVTSDHHPYGGWTGIFWGTIALVLSYWIVIGIGRISAAWDRGLGRSGNPWWLKVERTGFVLASALSGEKFSVSPALLRFATPSTRDVILTTQWCATLGMIAVQWPDFAYPILAQTSWATLLSNTTLVSGSTDLKSWSPRYSTPYEPPSNFVDQIKDDHSPLYMDNTAPNLLLTFPPGSNDGLAKYVSAIGVLPQNAFGICLATFLLIVGTVVTLSALIALIGWTGSGILGASKKPQPERKDPSDAEAGRRTPWKRRFSLNSFHGSVTHGNLVRLLVLFHLPITIYSCYHLQLDSHLASAKSKVLAGLSLALFSLLLPGWLIFRIVTTSTSKLYEATRTLLALGPLYNQYQPRSQLFCTLFFASNLIIGMVIGFGQKSGTVQAVIILVVEVAITLSTSVWLPWMTGAQMGVISFMFCVARIIATVLVVILAAPVSIGTQAAGWVAFGILAIMGLMYSFLAVMLITKLLEGVARLVRGLSFASSRHSLDTGLFGVLGCCGGISRRNKRNSRRAERRSGEGRARHSHGYSEASSHATTSPPYARGNANVSYLKPEQASIPYRESSDDDTGFIMESWSKTDLNLPAGGAKSGSKLALDDVNTSAASDTAPSTGFARVGGGRAHFNAPYAISSAMQPLAPGRSSETPAPPSQFTSPPPITPKPVSKAPDPLPKGAARPLHSRTRSQTAVIEDASALYPGGLNVASGSGKSGSRPGSSGNASRPGSSGKSHSQHGGRPGSSGKSPGGRSFSSRPTSGHGGRSPSREVPSGQGLLQTDEMGVNHSASKSASTPKGKGRGWFGLGGASGDSSSDEEEEEEKSKASSSKRGGRWGFKKRRKSESDMSPPVEQPSFVVIRNRPQQPAGPSTSTANPTESFLYTQGIDHYGSPMVEPPSYLTGATTTLISRTPLSPDPNESSRAQPPPSSYVAPRSSSSRRMSSPPT
ncbi:hypothetical protein FRC14_004035 [Serendipita sp. 396]|nr:hypothetical protein FRC14_004035 [Serendipita sp. 396]KAG8784611.1 hypothetical protein FRC15_002969 [Serendipita sp. 397]KAG8798632.1 hypothetical protein FRC16_006842 [Serendipita sp. 398]KAG8825664.1 hypothetical protein FRC19_010806 [Serendipita sp. 401]KAG8851895.1 hypothetical protein FRB91_007258 [Serendipita sp. 411]KAG8876207.1 hypothetical protein FRC20_002179 [Serendipita sp. 405]KAG9056518.1 hypothetical protein FS842_010425 [Serendipita sp. 407]